MQCNRCRKPAAQKCGRCRLTFYCSKECQRADWKQHKLVCEETGGSYHSPKIQGDVKVGCTVRTKSSKTHGVVIAETLKGYVVEFHGVHRRPRSIFSRKQLDIVGFNNVPAKIPEESCVTLDVEHATAKVYQNEEQRKIAFRPARPLSCGEEFKTPYTCPICKDDIMAHNLVRLACGHVCCVDCDQGWRGIDRARETWRVDPTKLTTSCPVCRSAVPFDPLGFTFYKYSSPETYIHSIFSAACQQFDDIPLEIELEVIRSVKYDPSVINPLFSMIRNTALPTSMRYSAALDLNDHLFARNSRFSRDKVAGSPHPISTNSQIPVYVYGAVPDICSGCCRLMKPHTCGDECEVFCPLRFCSKGCFAEAANNVKIAVAMKDVSGSESHFQT